MKTPFTYRQWIVITHALMWGGFVILMYLIFWKILNDGATALLATIMNLIGFLILVYGHLLYLLPRFFDKKQYVFYGTGIIILLLFTSWVRFYGGRFFSEFFELKLALEYFDLPYFGVLLGTGAFFLSISAPLRLVKNWFKSKELEQELKTQQLEAELRFLKAQVNPHFLFNALNNIYALSFTGSKKAPEMILKLSDMMSYMLYDCKSERVELSSEIAYLQNYISLQQLKKDGELNVSFRVEGNLESVWITPMLFIPFFENAFKHGNLEDTNMGWLKSTLLVEDHQLKFAISNSFKKDHFKTEKGGVGLENVKDRLTLLFPERHDLKIYEEKEIFYVHLTLNLNQV